MAMAMALPLLSAPCFLHCNSLGFMPGGSTCRSFFFAINSSRKNCGEFSGNSNPHLLRLWPPRRGGSRRRMREGMSSSRASSIEGDGKEGEKRELLASEDLRYLGKLFVGSVGGALVIKYGSLAVPTIAVPNINQALAMIVIPVAVSIVLLAFASVFHFESSK
ncbi:unnamed protein product [Sphagnum troendelagicum]|uniref:Uncharacterized protein n=1 Tax=Sphagnum troendelagicum TaxID=128251 RepID=A0ABP0V1U6_9BRYO